jgi:hypothetical protein
LSGADSRWLQFGMVVLAGFISTAVGVAASSEARAMMRRQLAGLWEQQYGRPQ